MVLKQNKKKKKVFRLAKQFPNSDSLIIQPKAEPESIQKNFQGEPISIFFKIKLMENSKNQKEPHAPPLAPSLNPTTNPNSQTYQQQKNLKSPFTVYQLRTVKFDISDI
jgi:hypothetical protein